MTVTIANSDLGNTLDFWRQRLNECATAMSNVVVTVGSTTTGNAAISGTLSANIANANHLISGNTVVNSTVFTLGNSTQNVYLTSTAWMMGNAITNCVSNSTIFALGNATVNATVNSTGFYVGNTTANIFISFPTADQISSGDYFLNANGDYIDASQMANPAGSDKYVQFNDAGSFNGLAGFTFTKGSNTLFVANVVNVGTVASLTNSTLSIGVTTVNSSVMNCTSYRVGLYMAANQTGIYHNGLINAASYNSTDFVANSSGVFHNHLVNAAALTVGTTTVANTSGVYTPLVNATIVNAAQFTVLNYFTVTDSYLDITTLDLYANGHTGNAGLALVSNGTAAYFGTAMASHRGLSIMTPQLNDRMIVLWTNTAIALAEINTLVDGSSPSVTTTWYYGINAFAASNTTIQAGIVTTSTTSGNRQTSFSSGSIPANNFVWMVVTATGGTVNSFHATVRFN